MEEPDRLKCRPHHGRLPVPFITAIIDGQPDFKVHDLHRRNQAARERLCQLCGWYIWGACILVGSEGSVERGSFGEPPMHRDCMEWAWEVCPWLAGGGWSGKWRGEATALRILPRPTTPSRMGIVTARDWSVVPDDEGSGSFKFRVSDLNVLSVEWRTRG